MQIILLRTLASVAVAIAISIGALYAIAPFMGVTVGRTGLILCTLVPIIVVLPFRIVWERDRAQLTDALAKFQEKSDVLSRTYASLQMKSDRDEMTGLLNRPAFLRHLEQARHAPHLHDGGALALIAVEGLRNINERHGASCGDDAILQVCDAVHRVARNGDLIGRIGGGEIALYMPGATQGESRHLVERLRREVERAPFAPQIEDAVVLAVHVGLGVTRRGQAIDDMMRIANESLLEAKSAPSAPRLPSVMVAA